MNRPALSISFDSVKAWFRIFTETKILIQFLEKMEILCHLFTDVYKANIMVQGCVSCSPVFLLKSHWCFSKVFAWPVLALNLGWWKMSCGGRWRNLQRLPPLAAMHLLSPSTWPSLGGPTCKPQARYATVELSWFNVSKLNEIAISSSPYWETRKPTGLKVSRCVCASTYGMSTTKLQNHPFSLPFGSRILDLGFFELYLI